MPSDTVHLRSAAFQIVVLATGVMGFGISNAFIFEFNASGGILNALAGVAGLFLGEPADFYAGAALDLLRLYLIVSGFALYTMTVVSAGFVMLRDNLNARALGKPYRGMAGTILAVGFLFIASIFDRDISQPPSVDIAESAAPTYPA